MKFIYCLIFFLWHSIALSVCTPPSYNFYCRGGGGITLRNEGLGNVPNSTFIKGKFKRNGYPYQVGTAPGSSLSPGSCTWYDRILSDEEPLEFQFQVQLTSTSALAAFTMLNQCISSSSCWFATCATSGGSNPFFLDLNDVSISWD